MSRIIVKNLPKKLSQERLKSIFSEKGEITDVQLKYTSAGKFRQFAFIGFKNEEQAIQVKDYFHNTYVDSSQIKVETCESLGSENVKPWSKYSKSKPDISDLVLDKNSSKRKKSHRKENNLVLQDERFEELKEDPKFLEFLSLQEKGKNTWSNDVGLPLQNNQFNSDELSESEAEEEIRPTNTKDSAATLKKPTIPNPVKKAIFDDKFTVKLRDLPFRCKKKQIKTFFAPLKICSLRIPPRVKGIAYVKFKNEKDWKQAMSKHRGFLEGNRVSVLQYSKNITPESNNAVDEKKSSVQDTEAEPLVETGRIFVRNLCYSTTVEDIEKHFQVFGPITEVHLPFDQFTKKIKGFAFVTFMFPEHAVKAFTKLDGSSFQGRTLHLVPAKVKKEVQEEISEDSSFKQKKELKVKTSSRSWHNWNTLFLGANAVADVMAEKYNTSKAKLLDPESRSSVAVTMALGETQIVSETREFLVSQGVQLEAFQNPQTERSKTIILVKNLPAKTKTREIRDIFSIYGDISRLLLPPSGVTAIIEFHHPTQAKIAFTKLAYSKFKHVPLYLEWAPVNVLSQSSPSKDSSFKEEDEEEEKLQTSSQKNIPQEHSENSDKEEEKEQEEEPQSGTILFVKNLNFDTREEDLRKHFEVCGKVLSATVALKRDHKNPGQQLSMGYGFVEFKKKKSATKALKELQRSMLDDHALELKISTRDTLGKQTQRKLVKSGEQKSTKILVRNIPFEASVKEIREIFSVFGELRALRLPSKVTGEHRGFGFVDFLTRHDAQRAMTSLGASTHVFGRRLVLEWAETDDGDNVEALRRKTARHYQQGGGSGSKRLKGMPEEPRADLSD